MEPLLLLPDLGQDRDGTIPGRWRSHSWGSELCSHFLRVAREQDSLSSHSPLEGIQAFAHIPLLVEEQAV